MLPSDAVENSASASSDSTRADIGRSTPCVPAQQALLRLLAVKVIVLLVCMAALVVVVCAAEERSPSALLATAQSASQAVLATYAFIVSLIAIGAIALYLQSLRRGRKSADLHRAADQRAANLGAALTHQGMHDSLTGLPNRREIERRLEVILNDRKSIGARHTFCIIDLDEFKLINDAYSHAIGDYVLRTVALKVSNEIDSPGWVGHLGGDEFAVLFEHLPLERGMQKAINLNRAISEGPTQWGGKRIALTCSIGVAEINRDTPSVGWLLRAADTACDVAKGSGRNRIRAYIESDRDVARRHSEVEWASQIRVAVAEGRLRLYAQRIEPLHDNAGQGLQYEVLVRLANPSGEVLLPSTFLSAAEHFSMATVIDRHVLLMTVDTLSSHPDHLQQLELCHVNISGQSATSEDFRQFVEALLRSHPAVAMKLCFELTETAAIDHVQANFFISAVRKLGCRIALDDFGNGLSSFAYLKNLPADIVKIDSIFMREIATDVLDFAVVRAVTDVCRSLGKRVVAEGVESVAAVEQLRVIGVDSAQGFAIHRPCPIEEIISRAH
jgi:diguanylate cyclase (GGDEF)-like protein